MYPLQTPRGLSQPNVYCVHAFFSALKVEGDGVSFADVVDEAANVDEDIFTRGRVNDETKTLGLVKKLYFSSVHW
jgi:hypothetical protein